MFKSQLKSAGAGVPVPRTAVEMSCAINETLEYQSATQELIWYDSRWSKMREDEKIRWVQIRMAPLLVVWERGGRKGFAKLGIELDKALHSIDL